MSLVKIAPVLNPVDWKKKVAAELDKPYGVEEELKKLYRMYDQLPLDLLDFASLESVAEAEERAQLLKEDFTKAQKALVDQAKTIATVVKKCEADFKKNDKAGKPAQAAPGAVFAACNQLCADIVGELTRATNELKTKTAALAKSEQAAADKDKKAEQAKNAKAAKDDEEDDADSLAEHKDEKKFRDKVKAQLVSWFKRVKAEGAPRAKFTVAVLGKTWGVYLAKSAGESEKKIAMRLAGLTSGFKHCKGEMYYDPAAKVWVFEGPNIPVGRANATSMSLALKPIMGYAPRLRLQKPGERGEDSEGADPDPDESAAVAEGGGAPKGPAGVDPLKAFTARLEALKPKILSAANADKVKQVVAQAADLARKGSVDKAQGLLGQIEDMLTGKPPKAPPEAPAAAGAKPASGDAAGFSLVKLSKARLDWATLRGEAVRGIEQLARRIEDEYRNEADQRAQVAEATKKLRSLAATLKEDLEDRLDQVLNAADAAARTAQMRAAKASLTEVLRVVATDPLMKELDGNELMPDLRIVKPMQDKLREIAAALS